MFLESHTKRVTRKKNKAKCLHRELWDTLFEEPAAGEGQKKILTPP
jgi:hypothetical protein